VISRTFTLVNHPPATFILVSGDPTGRNRVGTWTTTDPSAEPYAADVSLTGGASDYTEAATLELSTLDPAT